MTQIKKALLALSADEWADFVNRYTDLADALEHLR